MPTGYTDGVLSGKVTEFEVFAKQCLRAMGAAVHMRDDNFKTEYYPDKPSSYHIDRVTEITKELAEMKTMSDDDIVRLRKLELKNDKKTYTKYIKDRKEGKKRLDDMLKKVNKYTPPTPDHQGIKTFMIEQLESTISYDCDADYYVGRVAEVEQAMKDIDPVSIREYRINQLEKDLKYHSKEYQSEVDRCNKRHEWATAYLNSLK
jgi:hypothetical protein